MAVILLKHSMENIAQQTLDFVRNYTRSNNFKDVTKCPTKTTRLPPTNPHLTGILKSQMPIGHRHRCILRYKHNVEPSDPVIMVQWQM